MTKTFRPFLSALCAFVLAFSLLPATALGEDLGDVDDLMLTDEPVVPEAIAEEPDEASAEAADEDADVPVAESVETLETSVEEPQPFFLFSLLRVFDASGDKPAVQLKAGNYESWIDRIDDTGRPYVRKFYEALREAADGDGDRDYLIDDTYTSLSEATVAGGGWAVPVSENPSVQVGDVARINKFPCIVAAISDREDDAATQTLTHAYLAETYGAFDRDTPKAFWRSRSFDVIDATEVLNGKTYYGFVLVAGNYPDGTPSLTLRSSEYKSAQDIRADMERYDSRVSTILAGYTGDPTSEYEKVRYFNQWLVSNNSYNSNSLNSLLSQNKMYAWSPMSALNGPNTSSTEQAPVCEGFSRAMQALCLASNVHCVLVDGTPPAGPHMWNNVRVDGVWYGIDSTWNDTQQDIERFFLVGANTVIDGERFADSHPATNKYLADSDSLGYSAQKFTNGPALSDEAYGSGKADPTINALPTVGSSYRYGTALSEISLSNPSGNTPGTWSWADPSATVGDVGTNLHAAVFTPDDAASFRTATRDIAITVTPQVVTPRVTVVGGPFRYTGLAITPELIVTAGSTELASGDYVATFRDNVDAGTAVVTVSANGSGNYEFTESSATFTIEPATDWLRFSDSLTSIPSIPVGTPVALSTMAPAGIAVSYAITKGADIATILESTSVPSLKATAVGTITVRASSEGDANHRAEVADWTISSTAPDFTAPEGTTVLPVINPSYRVVGVGGLAESSLTKLSVTQFNTQASIALELVNATSMVMPTVRADQTAVYDLTLYVLGNDGEWHEADADTFPSEGIEVNMGFPKSELGPTTHRFAAAHMFTSEVNNHMPGEVETPDVTVDESGVHFRLMGCSPVSVSWEEVNPVEAIYNQAVNTSTTGQSLGNASTTTTGLSQTGDGLALALVVLGAAAIGGGIAFVMVRRRRLAGMRR